MLKYLNYDNLDVTSELKKIESSKYAEIILLPTNKMCLFTLGMLFANGIKIRILNEKDLNLEITTKSFTMMPYVWSKLGCDQQFPIKREMDERILKAKENGLSVEKIINKQVNNKFFLICPVRNATEEQRKWIENFVIEKQNQGYIVHAPHLHTNQNDLLGGFNVCKENSMAVASSKEVDIYYDQTSTGSIFDLGVAYALHKPIRLLNKEEITFRNDDPIDMIIASWPYKHNRTQKREKDLQELRDLKKSLNETKKYKLIDASGQEYLSDTKGTLGGHRKLKIYGKLDCKSAAKWIAKGKYVEYRVFFKDEATAIAAGYRPCAICMPEEYQKWKSNQKVKKREKR